MADSVMQTITAPDSRRRSRSRLPGRGGRRRCLERSAQSVRAARPGLIRVGSRQSGLVRFAGRCRHSTPPRLRPVDIADHTVLTAFWRGAGDDVVSGQENPGSQVLRSGLVVHETIAASRELPASAGSVIVALGRRGAVRKSLSAM